jgi:hypothetical protein
MHRKFIALILAAAVAVTSLSAAPAYAADKDLKRFILGVAALGIAAAAIENNRRGDDGRRNGHVSRQDIYHPPVVHAPQRGHGSHGGHVAPRPLPDRARAAVLPSKCLLQVSDRRGIRNVYGARCLERSNVSVARLPDYCALTVIGQQGRARTVYDAGCLTDNGYRTARR